LPTPSSTERPAPTQTKSRVARSKRDHRRAASASVTSTGPASTPATADDLSSNPVRDLIARIYEEELRKLMSSAEMKGNVVDAQTYEREISRLSCLRAAGTVMKPMSNSLDGGGSGCVVEDKENSGGVAALTAGAPEDDNMPQVSYYGHCSHSVWQGLCNTTVSVHLSVPSVDCCCCSLVGRRY